MSDRKRKVSYFYDPEYSGMYYGADHPMKPPRIAMTHHLVLGYGLHEKMDVYRPRRAQPEEFEAFHTPEYIEVLQKTSPAAFKSNPDGYDVYGLDLDCPIFPGMFDFCRLYTGASIEGAMKLNAQQYDVAINWAGGLHHAKKAEASGFCYINDCVLAIIELLKVHARVLYLDIDIHHGDGVEEAFYTTDRVMTLSFHMYDPSLEYGFFPGTGSLDDIGEGYGKGYALNVPLTYGCSDTEYLGIFKPIVSKVMEMYQPGAIVLQCGADSLVGDRVGTFNLTVEGHAEAVKFVKSFNIPMLVLGGGGYTKEQVSRAWTLSTAHLIGEDNLPDDLPETNPYADYYMPEFRLRYNRPGKYAWKNMNKKDFLEKIRSTIIDMLGNLKGAPSVGTGNGIELRAPEGLLREATLDPDGEDRLKKYVQAHFPRYLRCVEQGDIDPYSSF